MALKIITASAGSGKTFRLTLEYLILCFDHGPNYFSRILGMTFTNKAAWEMKESILQELDLLAHQPEKSKHKERLIEALPRYKGKEDKLREKAAAIQREVLLKYHDFSLSTIDSFFQRIVRAFFRELNLASNFDVELDLDQVILDALSDYLLKMDKEDPLIPFINRIQDELVVRDKSPNYRRVLEKLAGEIFKEHRLPDTRENKMILDEIYRKLKSQVDHCEEQYSAYQKKTDEILVRYDMVPQDFPSKNASFVSSFMNYEGIKMFNLLSGSRWLDALGNSEKWYKKSDPSSVVEKHTEVYGELNPLLEEVHDLLAKSELVYRTNVAILKNFHSFAVLTYIKKIIDDYTRENNIFLLNKTYELLRGFMTESDSPLIYERIGNRYQHLFIDEFQDTSRYQYENIRPLVRETLATGKDNLIVGDIKQAIYRFRNGDWSLLANEVYRDFNHHINRETLDNNYRSRPDIIDFNNKLYEQLADDLTTAFYQKLEEKYPDGKSDPEYDFIRNIYGSGAARQNNPMPEREDHSGHVQLECLFEDPGEGFDEVVFARMEKQLLELEGAGYSAGDIAVLTREKKQIKKLIAKLAEWEKKYPDSAIFDFYSEEVLSIADSPAVEMILSVMRMAAYGEHNRREMRRMLLQLQHFSRKLGLDLPFFQDTGGLFVSHSAPLPPELRELLDKGQSLGLLGFYSSIVNAFQLGSERVGGQFYFLAGFGDEIEQYVDMEGNDLMGFLNYWEERGSEKNVEPPSGSNKIQLMTIHKAKGLAFPIVFLPFTDHDLMPRSNKNTLWVTDERFVDSAGRPFDFPLNMERGLADTQYRADYWKEVFNNWIDQLNAFYVATTRPREALFIYCFKKLKGESDEDLAYHLSNFAGSQLQLQEGPQIPEGLKIYVKDFRGMSWLKKEYELKQDEDRDLQIPALYASSELPDIKSQWMYTRLSSVPSEERSAVEEGLLMHRVLELIIRREDLSRAVLTVVEEGQIPASEFDHWIKRIERAFAIKEVNRWFADGVEVLNERDILLPDGRRYRPDRVVLEGSKAVLIDYKTGSPGRHYHRQLQTYGDVVSRMGYSEVEGWLFYTDVLQVERVV